MSIDIIVISNMARLDLLQQTLGSLEGNASDKTRHSLTIVLDNPESFPFSAKKVGPATDSKIIITCDSVGASRARNIGASSIPKYRRNKYVMFFDDDVYALPHWDSKLMQLADCRNNGIISGYGHPYNHAELKHCGQCSVDYREPLVISTVAMMMSWMLWDAVGYYTEPGGAAGGEDYDYCMRAKAKDHGFAITEPQCIIHTGLFSSSGDPIVGIDLLAKQNAQLEQLYGIRGKVTYS